MSNGKYKSVEHRVTTNANQERLTISAFHVPSIDGVVAPVTSIAEERILYKTMGIEEYLKIYFSNKLEGKKALDHAKLQWKVKIILGDSKWLLVIYKRLDLYEDMRLLCVLKKYMFIAIYFRHSIKVVWHATHCSISTLMVHVHQDFHIVIALDQKQQSLAPFISYTFQHFHILSSYGLFINFFLVC